MKMLRLSYVLCLVLLLLSGCALQPTLTPTQEITQRVQARWNALIKNNWAEAYQFESPGYRSSHSLEHYQGRFGQALKWKEVKVDKVDITADKQKATVAINILFDVILPEMGTQTSSSYYTETWLWEDNTWWHFNQ